MGRHGDAAFWRFGAFSVWHGADGRCLESGGWRAHEGDPGQADLQSFHGCPYRGIRDSGDSILFCHHRARRGLYHGGFDVDGAIRRGHYGGQYRHHHHGSDRGL